MERAVGLIRSALTGKEYITVVTHEGRLEPRIETHQELTEITMWWENEGGYIHIIDTYGVWGIHSGPGTRIDIKEDRIQIEHQSGCGDCLCWVFVVTGKIYTPLEYVLATGRNYHTRDQ